MLVSVIMPSYNYGAYIAEAIGSVLAQTHGEIELIVVDDGSTDDTPERVRSIRDDRMTYIRTSNGGVSAARNRGLDEARGDAIAFLDADDLWMPDKLEKQVAALRDASVGFVFANFVRFGGSGPVGSDQFSYAPELASLRQERIAGTACHRLLDDALVSLLKLSDMPWYPTANMIRKSAIEGLRFPVGMRVGEDIWFFMRLWTRTAAAYAPEVLAKLRRHGSNASAIPNLSHQMNMIELLSGMRDMPLSQVQSAAVRRRLGRTWAALGYRRARAGRYHDAYRAYLRALLLPGARLNAAKHLMTIPLRSLVSRPTGAAPGDP